MNDPKTTPAFPLSRSHFSQDGTKLTGTDWMPGPARTTRLITLR